MKHGTHLVRFKTGECFFSDGLPLLYNGRLECYWPDTFVESDEDWFTKTWGFDWDTVESIESLEEPGEDRPLVHVVVNDAVGRHGA